jgi:hypothetical protein
MGKRCPKFLSFLHKNLTELVLLRDGVLIGNKVGKFSHPQVRTDFFMGDAPQVFETEKTELTTPL